MDIVSHGLWAAAASKTLPSKVEPVSVGKAFFWGVFPDLFAFVLPITWIIGNVLLGNIPRQNIPHPHGAYGGDSVTASIMLLADTLYQWSHSLVIFVLIVLVLRLVLKKYPWILFGWGLHIILDVPTHARAFYPTPVFWPLSSWTFDGIPWSTPWFLILNYILLLTTIVVMRRKRKTVDV